jgi:hypothetical protein
MMMEAVVDPANMERAWKQVRANRGAPGPDGITLNEFPEWVRPRWAEIRQQLLDGNYQPAAVRRKTIDKRRRMCALTNRFPHLRRNCGGIVSTKTACKRS